MCYREFLILEVAAEKKKDKVAGVSTDQTSVESEKAQEYKWGVPRGAGRVYAAGKTLGCAT